VHAIGSDMLAAQVLLLMPTSWQAMPSSMSAAKEVHTERPASDTLSKGLSVKEVCDNDEGRRTGSALDPRHGSNPLFHMSRGGVRQASSTSDATLSTQPSGFRSWQWYSLMLRTLGSRIELHLLGEGESEAFMKGMMEGALLFNMTRLTAE
jgi:hypothetical protein